MGQSISSLKSQDDQSAVQLDSSVLEIGFDDVAYNSCFKLEESTPHEQLELPDSEIIYDMLTDFLTYTSYSNLTDTFVQGVIPLFNSTLETKLSDQYVIFKLFLFLKERGAPLILQECRRKDKLELKFEDIRSDVALKHKYLFTTDINIDLLCSNPKDLFLKGIDEITLEKINPIIGVDKEDMVMAKINELVAQKELSEEEHAYTLLKWGFKSCTIQYIIEGLVLVHKLHTNKSAKTENFEKTFLDDYSKLLDLSNICFSPPIGLISTLNISSKILFSDSIKPKIAADGNCLYILDATKTLTIVSLSANISKPDKRFCPKELFDDNSNSAIDLVAINNNMYVLSNEHRRFFLYQLNPFQKSADFDKCFFSISGTHKINPKLSTPLASDGKYIYSLHNKKFISIFKENFPNIKLEKILELKMPVIGTMGFAIDKKDLLVVTNGLTISFIKCTSDNRRYSHYEYKARHYSLVNGEHICDTTFNLEYLIYSITYDYTNSCFWGIATKSSRESSFNGRNTITNSFKNLLINFPCYNGQAPWLTGISFEREDISLRRESKMDSHLDVFNEVSDLLKNIYSHFCTVSFNNVLNNHTYSVQIARFLAPSSEETLRSVREAFKYFSTLYLEKVEISDIGDPSHVSILSSLIYLYSYNLTNFDLRIVTTDNAVGDHQHIKNYSTDLDFLMDIIKIPSLNFLFDTIITCIFNSFHKFFNFKVKNLNLLPDIFMILIENMSDVLLKFSVQKIHDCRVYAYCFKEETVTKYWHKYINSYPEIDQLHLYFLETYMRALFVEVRTQLNHQNKPSEFNNMIFPPFYAFCDMMLDSIISRVSKFELPVNNSDHKIDDIKLYGKFITILHTFSDEPLIVDKMIEKIELLFKRVLDKVNSMKIEGPVPYEYMMFYYDVISILLDYTIGLTKNSVIDATFLQFSWLFYPTIQSSLNPEKIKDIIDKTLRDEPSKPMLRKGLSFNYNNSKANTKIDESFLSSLISKKEYTSITKLLNYLYTAIPDKMSKLCSTGDRQLERFILAAFTKQLGLTAELIGISTDLSQGVEKPPFSQYVKQCVLTVYKIRRSIKQSRQATLKYNERFVDATLVPSKKIYERYDDFISLISKKCIFLAHIQPSLRQFATQEDAFQTILKKVTSFIVADISLESFFEHIKQTKKSRDKTETSIRYIISLLSMNHNDQWPIYNSFLLEKLSTTNSFFSYLSLFYESDNTNFEHSVNTTCKMIHSTFDIIMSKNDKFSRNSMITFFANICFAVGTVSYKSVIDPVLKLLKYLLSPDSHFSSKNSKCLVSFIMSTIWVISKMNEDFASSDIYREFYNKVCKECSLDPADPTNMRLLFRSGMKSNINLSVIIKEFSICKPRDYYGLLTVLTEVIQDAENPQEIFYWVLKEISNVVSGGRSIFMKDSLSFYSDELNLTQTCKTPEIILGGGLKFIQWCRRLLLDSASSLGRCMLDTFCSILDKFIGISPDDVVYSKHIYLLYSVFAILSNVVNVISYHTLIEDTATSSTYYISDIDETVKKYLCWKIPISNNSTLMRIPFSSKVVPKSLTPFTIQVFPLFDKVRSIIASLINNKYINRYPGLMFYICSSLHEYSKDPIFTKKFISDVKIPFNPTSMFSFEDMNPDFLSILRGHLISESSGFQEPRESKNRLYHASASPVLDKSGLIFTDNSIVVTRGLHIFMSNIFPYGKNISFKIKLNSREQSFDAGFYHISDRESNIRCLMFSQRKKKISIYSHTKKTIPLSKNMEEIIFDFEGATNKCSISVNKRNNDSTYTVNFPSYTACFFILAHHVSNISYEILYDNLDKNNNIYPGSTTFSRKKRINNASHDQNYVFETFAKGSDQFSEMIRFNSPALDKGFFIMYPKSIVDKISKVEIIQEEIELENIPQPIFLPCDNSCPELIQFAIPPGSLLMTVDESSYPVFFCNKNYYSISKYTGSVSIASLKDEVVYGDFLPLIHPNNNNDLPPEILNAFTESLTSRFKTTVFSSIILRSITQENIISYDLSDIDILRCFLSLITISEPSFKGEDDPIIKFDLNILSTNDFIIENRKVINNILQLLLSYNNQEDFVVKWFRLLVREFNDPNAHSAKVNHSHVLFVDPNAHPERQIIKMKNAVSWLVLRTGFDSQKTEIAEWSLTHPERDDIIDRRCKSDQSLKKPKRTISNEIVKIPESKFYIKSIAEGPFRIVCIPLFESDTNTLSGTFYDLLIMFKYFVYYLKLVESSVSCKIMERIRQKIYCCVIDSIIAGSPAFITYNEEIIQFLDDELPLMSSNFQGDFIAHVNLLQVYAPKLAFIDQFVEELKVTHYEKEKNNLKAYFKYFASEIDIYNLRANPTPPKFIIPDDIFTVKYNISIIKRIFRPGCNKYEFPFYYLFRDWAIFARKYPNNKITPISQRVIRIEFTQDSIQKVILKLHKYPNSKFLYSFDINENNQLINPTKMDNNTHILLKRRVIYIQIDKDQTLEWDLVKPYFVNAADDSKFDEERIVEFLLKNREQFVEDMKIFINSWDANSDGSIIGLYNFSDDRQDKEVIDPEIVLRSGLNHAIHNLLLRAKFIVHINKLYKEFIQRKVKDERGLNAFTSQYFFRFISPQLKYSHFYEIIKEGHERPGEVKLNVDRKSAYEVREGVSTDYEKTLMAQFTKQYDKPSNFRSANEKPWDVNFQDESGIDVGGPARELVAELALDFMSPNCGLVTPVPNSKTDNGQFKDSFIPIPHPDVRNVEAKYKASGALIAICSRTKIVQDFNFPPLVWEYIISKKLDIQSVYSIDEGYKGLIELLKNAENSSNSDEDFRSKVQQTFIVLDFYNNEIPLIQRGRHEVVTLSNVSLYITLSNDYKVRELRKYLEYIRIGFWENIGFAPNYVPIDWATLEFMACGERVITVESLKSFVKFKCQNKEQIEIFWRVIEEMTPNQRTLLLRFATGRTRLPPPSPGNDDSTRKACLEIDFQPSSKDLLPTSSTCFHQLHLSEYTSFEKAFKLITLAIEYTGTFELR